MYVTVDITVEEMGIMELTQILIIMLLLVPLAIFCGTFIGLLVARKLKK